MRALKDIAIAFVPMNLPFTMDIDQASSAVAEFKPGRRLSLSLRGTDRRGPRPRLRLLHPIPRWRREAGTAEGDFSFARIALEDSRSAGRG